MKIIILNWTKGNNDPFTYGNNLIAQYLQENGRPARVLDIETPNLANALQAEKETGIDFVLTCQGFGSDFQIAGKDNKQVSMWSHLGIPLICVHADHPSIMPDHHTLESPLCKHLYYDEDACLFSNQYFRSAISASMTCTCPLDVYSPSAEKPEGKYFVLMKNLEHPDALEKQWKTMLSPAFFAFFMRVVEQVKALVLTSTHFVDFHAILDKAIADDATMRALHHKENHHALFLWHRHLDLYVRHFKSVELLKRLREYPVRVFGKGWDIEKAKANNNHTFHDGVDMAASKKLYYSEYGILDVSPFRGLHDRSLRAIYNRTAFLSDADISRKFPGFPDYAEVFYNFSGETLEARCENIMRNPQKYRDLAIAFSKEYQIVNPANEFVKSLDIHAQSMRRI